jgi:hypothetical protein
MSDSGDTPGNPLPLLLVAEALREFDAHFPESPEKASQMESQMIRLGRKPGFACTAQLLRSAPDLGGSPKDIAEFLGARVSVAIVDIPARASFDSTNLSMKFTYERLPAWFVPIIGEPHRQPWVQGFAHFLMGFFSGALLHFGYRTVGPLGTYELTASALTLTFRVQQLDAAWEFGGNYH